MAKRIHRKIKRTKADQERLKSIREKFQQERPSLDELVRSGEFEGPVSQETYLEIKALAALLKQARQEAKMSLAEVAEETGLDRSMVSRLERGLYPNTTVNTLAKLAGVYGKRFVFSLTDDPEFAHK